MAIKIKNIDTNVHDWGGRRYEAGETYTTENIHDVQRYGFDDDFLMDYKAGLAEVYDGDTLITSCSRVVYLLQNGKVYTPADSEDKPYVRVSQTQLDYHYGPRSLDFYTAKAGSLYNRKHDNAGIDDGTDIGDAVLRFYECGEYGAAVEMVQELGEEDVDFQSRLSQYCVKTVCEFEHAVGIDIWGAKWMFNPAPSERAYLWVIAAPDVPEAWGGSVAFMGGGMALHLMAPKNTVPFDAKTTKYMPYDETYHSGKVAIVLKHSAGEQIGIQLILDYYEE